MKRLICLAACLALLAGNARAGDESVSLIFAGDVMLDDGPGRLIAAGGDPLGPVAPLLADADYRIANLECSVSTRGASLPGRCARWRTLPARARLGQGALPHRDASQVERCAGGACARRAVAGRAQNHAGR